MKHKIQCDCPDPNCILKTACGVEWLDKAFELYEEILIGNEDIVAMRNILPLKKQILFAHMIAKGWVELPSEDELEGIFKVISANKFQMTNKDFAKELHRLLKAGKER